jgi:hypothetical protein
MAKARMLHKKISVSVQVNKLTLPARLLFTWMIPHADDEGKLKGDIEFIRAMVIPMTKWSFKKIKGYLMEMKDQGLIYYWQENDEWFIEFIKWKDHQYIQKDRFKPSDLPSFHKEVDNKLDTNCIHEIITPSPQLNISESNLNEVNKSEVNESNVADKSSYKGNGDMVNPKTFKPSSDGELAALEAWKKLEPENPVAFKITYLHALSNGLPSSIFYLFTSEIRQDNTIKNPGAVFNKKVKDYFER